MSDKQPDTQLPSWIFEHVKLYLSDPEKAHMWDATMGGGVGMLPTLLLESVGRKSGDIKMLPLIYKLIDGNYVVVASKGGNPTHPVWFLNLQAEPACQIRAGAKIMKAKARTAAGDERTRLWQEMVDIYSPYADYQERAGDREIPIVVLEVTEDVS